MYDFNFIFVRGCGDSNPPQLPLKKLKKSYSFSFSNYLAEIQN